MPAKKIVQPFAAQPFLKWAGSKRQLLRQFIHLYPPALKAGAIENYYEPFLGGGAVFFDIVQRYQPGNIFLSDINKDLVTTYQVVQSSVAKLIEHLWAHQQQYLPLNKTERMRYFYAQRAVFNQAPVDKKSSRTKDKAIARAAQLIFLNRTCFNGLFRVNSKGQFNTPAGDYAKPAICDEQNLLAVADVLAGATISNIGFAQALKNTGPAAFVYFDPPYRPLSATASFRAYSQLAFADAQQEQLAQVCRQLTKKKVAIMLSNSDTGDGFFDHLYQGFQLLRVPARRLINADASKRGPVNEIVVTNYPLQPGPLM